MISFFFLFFFLHSNNLLIKEIKNELLEILDVFFGNLKLIPLMRCDRSTLRQNQSRTGSPRLWRRASWWRVVSEPWRDGCDSGVFICPQGREFFFFFFPDSQLLSQISILTNRLNLLPLLPNISFILYETSHFLITLVWKKRNMILLSLTLFFLYFSLQPRKLSWGCHQCCPRSLLGLCGLLHTPPRPGVMRRVSTWTNMAELSEGWTVKQAQSVLHRKGSCPSVQTACRAVSNPVRDAANTGKKCTLPVSYA